MIPSEGDLDHLPSRAPVWGVGDLCRAVASSLDARFNPVTVRGELTGFSRAASGHCYFSVKDTEGQIRGAMFRRAASLLGFAPRDGELVDIRGRLGIYEQRGDLQLVAESMSRVGAGGLYEQFMQRKARLEAEGLFDAGRKRPLPPMPRGIGLVTSTGAAALHDVATALRRRVPHVPVVLVPASVQGADAPLELIAALQALYRHSARTESRPVIDLILLVRGGGSMEDLWAFNDEALVRTIAQSPVPVITGVGHETDFTLADFVADVRAPTPTSAAELAAPERKAHEETLLFAEEALRTGTARLLDRNSQRLDVVGARLGRPSYPVSQHRGRLEQRAQTLQHAVYQGWTNFSSVHRDTCAGLFNAIERDLRRNVQRLERASIQLEMLDPSQVLGRGYALLQDRDGHVVRSARQTQVADILQATLSDGELELAVLPPTR